MKGDVLRKIRESDPLSQFKKIKQVVIIKGKKRDVISFITHIKIRQKIFRKAPSKRMEISHINLLANELHPPYQNLSVVKVTEQAPGVKTFRLKKKDGSPPAPFRAGQYVVIEAEVEGVKVSRPFSLSLSPGESQDQSCYDITIKRKPNVEEGFLSIEALFGWSRGTPLIVSSPMGNFYYDNLRDLPHLLLFAGGSGITPFRSMISSLLLNNRIESVSLFYGFSVTEELLFNEYFLSLEKKYPKRFQFIPVFSGEDLKWKGERGFITKELIQKYSPFAKKSSWFICGPRPMKKAVSQIAEKMKIRKKQLRFENFTPDKPSGATSTEKVKIIVHCENTTTVIEGYKSETVVSALDRAGLNPPVYCRSGECGWCRSRLISGEVEVPEEVTGVREADHKFGFFHPCSSFPLTDLEIRVNRNPLNLSKSEQKS